jgi:hypothetical protein
VLFSCQFIKERLINYLTAESRPGAPGNQSNNQMNQPTPMEPNMPSLLGLARRPARPREQIPAAPRKPTATEQDTPEPDPAPQNTRSGPTLSTLPPELHLLIAQHLIYPDALSLKYANRHFYQLVDTGVQLKVEWLMERRLLHLECPSDQRCDLGSDLRFCRGSVKYAPFFFPLFVCLLESQS